MKKILVIKGSARENGYTNRILKEALVACGECEITVFDTYKAAIKPCTDCRVCLESKKCIYNDLNEFFNKFENVDVIVFASPVFNGGFSAPMKALIDRFQVYFNLFYLNGKIQPIKKHRKAILLCACGREAGEEFSYMKARLEKAFTILNMSLCDGVLCENTDKNSDYFQAKEEFLTLLKRSLNDE